MVYFTKSENEKKECHSEDQASCQLYVLFENEFHYSGKPKPWQVIAEW